MKKTIEVMNTWEAIRPFIADPALKNEYLEESANYRNMDLLDDISIQLFLDNDAEDIRRLSNIECNLLGLDYNEGWYIDTWNDNYLGNA